MWRRSFLLRACAVKKTPQETPRLLTTSRENIEGTVVTKELGVVVGNAVLGKNLFSDFLSRMQNLLGGELGLYTHLVEEATAAATRKAMAEATRIDANAVLRLRFNSAALSDSVSGLMIAVTATGTAVRLEDDPNSKLTPVKDFITAAPPVGEKGDSKKPAGDTVEVPELK